MPARRKSFSPVIIDGRTYAFHGGQWGRKFKPDEEPEEVDSMPEWMREHNKSFREPKSDIPGRWDHLHFLREQGVDIKWTEMPGSDIGPLTPLGPPSVTSQRVRDGLPVRCPGCVYNPQTNEFSLDAPKPHPSILKWGALKKTPECVRDCEKYERAVESVRKEREAWGYFEEQEQAESPREVQAVQERFQGMQIEARNDVQTTQE